ncbi:hypothetical protein [Bacillus sp. ISL-39]|uniref:hypothetical protein n=1 Tax=Bacillus sp. ISL-39 TaxID=2819124 RepID=UPI001BEA3946|nr:hypothetical protein [Bacillus sp. ISL-39]MBT2639836.1 hypothetical protein [Bacillus sp. ISL-39]
MANVSMILLIIGLVSLGISFIFLIMRMAKGNYQISAVTLSVMLIGVICIFSGVGLMIPELKERVLGLTAEQEVDAEFEGQAEEQAGEQTDEKVKPDTSDVKKITEFKQIKLAYPKVIYEAEYSGYKEYQDADGTVYKNMTMINPDGVMMGFSDITVALVASPVDNPNNDGFAYYKGYYYYKGSYHFEVSEGTFKYESREAAAPYFKGFTPDKTEQYSSMDMQLYDFVYKFMPVQFPQEEKLVDVPLLIGEWASFEDTIMDGPKLLAKLNFFEDGFLSMENRIINSNEIPDNMQYKFEQLDENAYKLYLYPVTGTGHDGGYTTSLEPAKRNFILYVTSKDSFELVYYDQNLKRNSITMNRM